MIVTVTGTPGSGKSTVAKALAKEFSLRHYSSGQFMRDMADKRGVSLMDLTLQAEEDRSIDREIDDYVMMLGRQKDDFVIDSRLAFHFIPDSIKVFLKCAPGVAAERIARDVREHRRAVESEIASVEDALGAIQRRRESERKRYQEYYGVDIEDESQFDIVIDTSDFSIEESIAAVVDAVRKHLNNAGSGVDA